MKKPDYFISPEDILFDLGISTPEEIDLELISNHCGVNIKYESLTGCEACLIGHGNSADIIINKDAHPSRKRFSIAHELGHWMNDRNVSSFKCTQHNLAFEWGILNPETRANMYASELLMPKSLINEFLKGKELSFELIIEIANAFNTSITSAAIRVIKLCHLNAMLILNSPKRREWFIRSPYLESMGNKIWPTDNPGLESNAHKIFNGATELLKPLTLSADNWISNDGSYDYEIFEDSILSYQGKVLSLIVWKDESQLIDLESDPDEDFDDSFSPRFK